MIDIPETLNNIIDQKSGSPSHRVSLYETNFSFNSKGISATYYSLTTVGSTIETNKDAIRIFGSDVPYITGIPVRTEYISSIRLWLGSNPPLGITSNDKGFAIKFDAYFIVPQTGTYHFRIFSSLYCKLSVADTELFSGRSSDGKSYIKSIYLTEGTTVPFNLICAQVSSLDATTTSVIKDAYLLVEWRQQGDDFNYKPVDVGYFTPGATVENIVGSAINTSSHRNLLFNITSDYTNINSREIIGESSDAIVPTKGTWNVTDEYVITFQPISSTIFYYYVNGTYKGSVHINTITDVDLGEGKYVTLHWGKIEQNSQVIIKAPNYLDPLVSTNGLPHIREITENRAEGEATTYTFTVPLTTGKWNPRKVTPDNCYSYDSFHSSFGVLRKHRYIMIEQGFSDILVERFKGFISSISVQTQSTETILTVTCIDLCKLLIEKPIMEAPDFISWMRYGSNVELSVYNPSQDMRDNLYKPKCYDAWSLVDIVKDLCYMAGLSSQSIATVDEHGLSYITDNGTRLPKSIDYPHTAITTIDGAIRESEYLWQIEIGTTYWDVLNRIDTEFGRPFRILPSGIVDFRLPDNPYLLKLYYDPSDPHGNSEDAAISTNERIIPKVTPEKNARGIRGFFYTNSGSTQDAWIIKFQGQGLSLIVARTEGSQRIQVEVDDVLVDGVTVLDDDTEDTGDAEYTDYLDNSWYPLRLSDINGNKIILSDTEGYWAWSNGIHPLIGSNPCVVPICRNLTWGWHTVKVHTSAIGNVRLDGAYIYKDNKSIIAHIFSESTDLVTLDVVDTDEYIRNSVTVMNTFSSKAGNPILYKAVNLDSLSNPESPIYIGYEKPLIIVTKGVSQSKADFIANNLLVKYTRVIKIPTLRTIMRPHLIEGDSISIIDYDVGMRFPISLQTTSNKLLTLESARGNKFWITSLTSTMTSTDWSMDIQVTPFAPSPAYEPIIDAPKEVWGNELISNIKVYAKNSGYTTIFNPYTEDTEGEQIILEFDMPYNARILQVDIRTNGDYKYKLYPNLIDSPSIYMLPGAIIRTLLWNEDVSPLGHYKIVWDGWWDNESEQGEEGSGGRYMPSSIMYDFTSSQKNRREIYPAAQFYFTIYVQRESDGRVMSYTTNNTYYLPGDRPNIIRTNVPVGYSGSAVTYTFPNTLISTNDYIDYRIYDFVEDQVVNPGVFVINAVTNRPMSFHIRCFAYLLQACWTSGGGGISPNDISVLINGFEVPIFDSPNIFPSGEYSFYFCPSNMIRNVTNINNLQSKVSKFEAEDPINKQLVLPSLPGISTDAVVPFGYVYPTTHPTWKTLDRWNLWLFFFPSANGVGSGRAGCMAIDKDFRLYSNPTGKQLGTSLNIWGIMVQWFGWGGIASETPIAVDLIDFPLGKLDPGIRRATVPIIEWEFTKVYEA